MTDLITTVNEGLAGKRILIVGDLVADQFLTGSISRVSREAPVFILRHEVTETRPGAAANAAANIASLGGRPILIGVMGDDENGRSLRDSLEQANVDCANAVTSDSTITTTKVRVLAGQHYSAKQQVIRIDYENADEFDSDVRSTLIANARNSADIADAIIVSDYGYGVVDQRMFDELRQAATDLEIPLVLDSRHRVDQFRGATSATPNQEEVQQLLGPNFSADDCVELCRQLGFESLLVTRGNGGMLVVEPGQKSVGMPAIGPTEPVDVTGAGDTVIAAYALGLASGLGFVDAARIANHAGGVVVMKKGTSTVSKDELLRSLMNDSVPALFDRAG